VTENPSEAAPACAQGILSRMWLRILLRILLSIVHLVLIGVLFALTPDDYITRFGADFGMLLMGGCILLWILLWCATTARLVLLFCCLMLAQIGIGYFFVHRYFAEDKVLREAFLELVQIPYDYKNEVEKTNLSQDVQRLLRGSGLSPEELPVLLNKLKGRVARDHEFREQYKRKINEAEQRIAVVSKRAASNFRKDYDSRLPAAEDGWVASDNYMLALENLVSFLIEKKGHYKVNESVILFDGKRDSETYQDLENSLNKLNDELIQYETRDQSELSKSAN
jgi:hypothetical protein